MYASAEAGNAAATVVAGVFALVTVLTMLAVVLIGLTGLSRLRIPNLERYEHAIAGSAIMACGLAIQFLGL
jgi:hypothetical protein